jgi:ElaB/YqjD/DUF883 family membrane-anchored ribosome-binding protein
MKMVRLAALFIAAVVLFSTAAGADLATIKAEPNLEKRAEKALDNADDALKAAQDAYNEQYDLKKTELALKEVSDSVELAYESLVATGKNPSRSPKHFKRAEIKTRELMRRLDDLRARMGTNERQSVEDARHVVQKVHDNLLEGIMGGGKKKK